MAGIHDAFRDDDVSGQIIGGEYICGQLTYQGRNQGRQMYAVSDTELREKAKALQTEILAHCGESWIYIYPDRDAWSLKILG